MTIARCALVLAAITNATAALARDEPLWEAGIGIAAVHFPDYRGSSHSRTYALPAPYLVYRGEFLKADRYGLRAMFFKSDRLDVNLSVGASLPVHSNDNSARAGMPDLRPSIEVGPSIAATLWRDDDARIKLDARFPLRAAMTVESHPRFIGGQFYPHLNLDIHSPGGLEGWNLGLAGGPIYTDGRYNRYFYEVKPEFATASRPAYSPGGGYGGMQFLVALSKRFPRFWVGGFARYDSLNSAVFADSPLVTSKRYLAGGIGISWIFAESSRRVEVERYGDERK